MTSMVFRKNKYFIFGNINNNYLIIKVNQKKTINEKFDENKVGMFFHNFRGGPQYNPETKKWNGTFIDWNLVTR